MDKYVSAIISSRVSACDFICAGPLATNHAAFICGRPEILERPLMVKVSALAFATKLDRGVSPSAKSRKTPRLAIIAI